VTDNYVQNAVDDAAKTVKHFADAILDQLFDDGKASDDLLNDYDNGDAYHHEKHVDRAYRLLEAATLIDQLSDYEETDSGLWEGLQPKEAIGACAAFTYGNAVYGKWRELIEEINTEAADIITHYDDRIILAELADEDTATLENLKKAALRKLIAEVVTEATAGT
jgi:hypothetical protein